MTIHGEDHDHVLEVNLNGRSLSEGTIYPARSLPIQCTGISFADQRLGIQVQVQVQAASEESHARISESNLNLYKPEPPIEEDEYLNCGNSVS